MDLLSQVRQAVDGRYSVERELGRGGMAVVFLAQDRKHDRPIALKVLRPELAGSLLAARFLQEVRISARLQHPFILPVLDSGEAEGLLYFTMPFVEGETLRSKLDREGQLSTDETIGVVGNVCRALDYAHSLGVIHRDIKPENIFLSGTEAIVGDFGVASAVSVAGGGKLTQSGYAVGTPAYMSPEQASGEARVDGRSDIYSLGCMTYEMLAGEPPFSGPTGQAIIAKQASQRAPPLTVVRPELPWGMIKAVEKALAKVPADRYTSPNEFAEALKKGIDLPSPPPPRPGIPKKLAAAVMLALLVLLATWAIVQSLPPRLDPRRVVVFPLVTSESSSIRSAAGEELAILIGNSLDRTEPLIWEDGWDWLTADQRNDPRTLLPETMRRIAEDRGAAHFVDGRVLPEGDSITVVMRLHDVRRGTIRERSSARASPDDPGLVEAGLRAISALLPTLIDAGNVNFGDLEGSEPAAVALWLQGEREYRRSQYTAARGLFLRALEVDSTLAVAALGAAQAGVWDERLEEANRLVDLALTPGASLSPRQEHLARGMRAELDGQGDSAVYYYKQAVSEDPEWAEAWMGLGEVYYHLLPQEAPLDSLAEAAFNTSLEADPDFMPPLFHLSEFAVGRGDLEAAEAYLRSWREQGGDTILQEKVEIMARCVRQGPDGVDWSLELARNLPNLLRAAKTLTGLGAHLACAERGFREVLASPGAGPSQAWGALLGLSAVLVAEGRSDDLVTLLATEEALAVSGSDRLHLIASTAAPGFSSVAPEVAARLQDRLGTLGSADLWVLGSWAARNDRGELLERALNRALGLAEAPGTALDRLVARVLEAHQILVRGDSAEARTRFADLEVQAPRPDLAWSPWEPLALERVTLARLDLDQGDVDRALRLARGFGSPQPVMFVMYRPESLRLTIRAARLAGDERLVSECESALRSLLSREGEEGR